MKFQNPLKKKSKGTDAPELAEALNTILKTEKLSDSTKTELENAQKHLENEQQRVIDGDEGADVGAAVKSVVEEKTRLEALESLLGKAKAKAMGLIAAGSAAHRTRLVECEVELADTRRAIDERTIKIIAEFAKKHSWRVSWPTKQNGGAILVPAMTVEGEELEKIAGSVMVSVHRDEAADKYEELQSERQRLIIATRSTPDLALDSLLAEHRRKK